MAFSCDEQMATLLPQGSTGVADESGRFLVCSCVSTLLGMQGPAAQALTARVTPTPVAPLPSAKRGAPCS